MRVQALNENNPSKTHLVREVAAAIANLYPVLYPVLNFRSTNDGTQCLVHLPNAIKAKEAD